MAQGKHGSEDIAGITNVQCSGTMQDCCGEVCDQHGRTLILLDLSQKKKVFYKKLLISVFLKPLINIYCQQSGKQLMMHHYSCLKHENQEITQVCTEKHCKGCKLLCKECVLENDLHPFHHKITFEQFTNVLETTKRDLKKAKAAFKEKFHRIRSSFDLYLQNVQDMFEHRCELESDYLEFADFKELQVQQISGLAENFISNQSVQKYILTGLPFERYSKVKEEEIEAAIESIESFEKEIFKKINSLFLAMKKQSFYQQKQNQIQPLLKQESFSFSQKWRSDLLLIENQKTFIRKNFHQKNGYSVYGVVQQPLNQQNPSISFRIDHQGYRFMYLGVCDPLKFEQYNFQGPVYQMGKSMIAIRQHEKQGQSAKTLHDSLHSYSNKSKVGWDFGIGDTITIRLEFGEKNIVFEKNKEKEFSMPLATNKKEFFAFVGMKCTGDRISIL